MSLLSLERVSKRYADPRRTAVALDGVSLAVEPGEIVAVWGGRGSGRTTLLRVGTGLEQPDAGRVVFDGVDLAAGADKSAYYYCVLVFVRHADDPQPVIAEGRWDGEVIAEPRGEGGFGYDPHFLLPELGRTAAELAAEEKNRLSHRGKALRVMVEKLR